MNTPAVKFDGVEKSYPYFKLSVGLEVPRGSIVGFVGPNGAGKSTTIRILMGLVHQDCGEVRVLDHPMPAEQADAKRDIGFASEDMKLYGYATLAWHMGFIESIYPGWDPAYAESLLCRFDLRPQQKIKGLSHGQSVKAALLLVLARRPRLLVLDEPTAGLDPVARHEVLAELMEVLADEDRTILFSSHNTLDIEQISDQITFIDRGRIIDSRDKETFLDRWRRVRLEVPEGGGSPGPAGRRWPEPERSPGSRDRERRQLRACRRLPAGRSHGSRRRKHDPRGDLRRQRGTQPPGARPMNASIVRHLILKDWYFQRVSIVGYIAVGAIALALIRFGGEAAFYAGSVLLITVLIAVGIQLVIMTVIQERTQKTLAFVMSLPISTMEYTTAKILANLLIFLVPWATAVVASFVVIAGRDAIPNGLIPFTAVVLTEILVAYCLLLGVALVSESEGWTIVTMVACNLFFQFFLYWISHVPAVDRDMEAATAVWSPPLVGTLSAELVLLIVIVGLTFLFQSRKTDFI